MKTHEVELCGQRVALLLNGQALFDIYEKFGTDEFITEHIKGQSKASFENACWMLAKLAEQGELWRRWQGMDKRAFVSEHFFRVNLSPRETIAAKDAIRTAIYLGFAREETEGEGDVDIYAEELKKKQETKAE